MQSSICTKHPYGLFREESLAQAINISVRHQKVIGTWPASISKWPRGPQSGHQLLRSYQPGQIKVKEQSYLYDRWRLPISGRGDIPSYDAGSYRHRSIPQKLYFIKDSSILKYMISSSSHFMSQNTIGDHGSGIAISPVCVSIPKLAKFWIISCGHIGGLK